MLEASFLAAFLGGVPFSRIVPDYLLLAALVVALALARAGAYLRTRNGVPEKRRSRDGEEASR